MFTVRYLFNCAVVSPLCFTVNYIFNCTVKYFEMIVLPRKGYKCITVTDKVHQDIRKRAEEANLTLKEYVEYLLAKDQGAKAGK